MMMGRERIVERPTVLEVEMEMGGSESRWLFGRLHSAVDGI